MPYNRDLDKLAQLAAAAAVRFQGGAFAGYLELRASGRRKEALRQLDIFIHSAAAWPFEERLSFLHWIIPQHDLFLGNLLMPEPLYRCVISPTAEEWLSRQPNSSEANYIYAVYSLRNPDAIMGPLDYLRKAVDLDPANQKARKKFIDWVTGHAKNSQHELPWYGYLGSVFDDIRDLEDANDMLPGVENELWRQEIAIELGELLEAAQAWGEYEQGDRSSDFESWCLDRGGPAHLLARIG